MERTGFQKVGIYVDVANIAQNGGYGIAYDVLREFACRNHGTAVRLNAYLAFDEGESEERCRISSSLPLTSMLIYVIMVIK